MSRNSSVCRYLVGLSEKSPSRAWSASSPPEITCRAIRPGSKASMVAYMRAATVGATKPGRCASRTPSRSVAFSTWLATVNPSGEGELAQVPGLDHGPRPGIGLRVVTGVGDADELDGHDWTPCLDAYYQ